MVAELTLFRHSWRVMNGPAEVQLLASSARIANEAFTRIVNDAEQVEATWSRYRPDSIISRINRAAGKEPIVVDAQTAGLLQYAEQCFQMSEGLFDITSGVLRTCWDFKSQSLPSAAHLRATLPLVGWGKVQWNPPTVFLPEPGMEIDFGGIGKEYAVDRAAEILREMNIANALINFAGDVRGIGYRQPLTPWTIGIVHPRNPNEVIAAIEILSGALATSGDYEKFIEVNGKRYCHILNPTTGWSVDDLQSVSVKAPSCLVAGTAATVSMLLGEEKGLAFLRDLAVPFLMITKDGSVIRNA